MCCDEEITAATLDYRNGRKVKELSFFKRLIDDTCLANLEALESLEFLELYDTGTTDAALRHVTSLTRLRHLDLSLNRELTDASLGHLTNLRELRVLKLKGLAGLTDATLSSLSRLQGLMELDLFGTSISAAGLTHLHTLSRLQALDLPFVLTDETLPLLIRGLRPFRHLKRVDLAGPYWEPGWGEPEEPEQFTDARWSTLRLRLPNCTFGVRLD